MSKKRKKVLSILLVLVILGSLVPLISSLQINACDTGQQSGCNTGQNNSGQQPGNNCGQQPGNNGNNGNNGGQQPPGCSPNPKPTCGTPAIKLDKSGPETAKAGDTITYTFTVTNSGTTDLSNVTVTDALLGMTKSLGAMAKGCEPITFTYNYTIPASATGSIKNTATATGKYSCKTVSSTDNWTVTIPSEGSGTPAIKLDKSGPETAKAGDTITYTFTVTNSGTTDLSNVTVTDALLGMTKSLGAMAKGCEPITFTYNYTIPASATGSIKNTATATGKYSCKTVSSTDNWTVTIPCTLIPGISLTKSGPTEVAEGGTITYTLVVTNTGTTPLTLVTVIDPMLGGIIYGPACMVAGQSETITRTYKLAAGEGIPDGIDNTACASGFYFCTRVDDDASWHVNVTPEPSKNPDISIEKNGTPDPVNAGGTIDYTLLVTNTGDVELSNVVVKDDKLGIDESLGTLEIGGTRTVTGSYKTGMDETSVYNKATVEGHYNSEKVTDSDDVTICVIKPKPDINIRKDGPGSANIGEEVTYQFTVTNTGEVDLTDVVVTDTRIGMTENIGSLAVDETKTIDFKYTVKQSDGTLIVNTAGVTGKSDYGTVTDSDSHEMIVKSPAIDIEKSGPGEARIGDIITYTFVVTNTGNVTLDNVVVTDAKLGLSKDLGSIAAGASTSFTDTYEVLSSDLGELLNTATVTGDSPSGPVEDKDVHKVVVVNPGIELVKTGPDTAYVGDTITYTFTVTNTGTVPLFAVSVYDPTLNWYVQQLTILCPGESLSWNVDHVIDEDTPDPLYNTADAAGCTLCYGQVNDQDDHVVDILHPNVGIEKNGPEIGCRGQNVTYEFTVTNSGDVELNNLVVTDDVVGDIGTIDSLAAGASTTLTKEYTIKAEDNDPLINKATVTVVSGGKTLTASDTHLLDILTAGVEIVKTGASEAYVGDEVTYNFKVTNTGEATLSNLVVTDDILGDIGTIDTLESGAYTTLTAKHTITSTDKDPLVNVATVTGKTPCGLDVTDTDDHELDILEKKYDVKVGEIQVEKTVNDSDATVTAGDEVSYTIKVSNTGATAIPGDIKLVDTYDTDYLSYDSADPASDDNNDDGEINWADISEGEGLEPEESISVTVNFVAKKAGETENACVVTATDEDGTELKDNDSDPVTIEAKKLSTTTPVTTTKQSVTPTATPQTAATTAATTASLPYTGDNLSILIMMAVLMMTTGPLVILTDKIRRRKSGR